MSLPIDLWRGVGGKPAKVCRNLFGPVDRQLLGAELRSELRDGLEAAKRRWGFDFEEERPVPGALQWEAVSSRDVPAFYRPSVCSGPRKGPSNPLWPRGGAQEGDMPTRQDANQTQSPHNRKRKQTVITDFYTLKRRFGSSGSRPSPKADRQ